MILTPKQLNVWFGDSLRIDKLSFWESAVKIHDIAGTPNEHTEEVNLFWGNLSKQLSSFQKPRKVRRTWMLSSWKINVKKTKRTYYLVTTMNINEFIFRFCKSGVLYDVVMTEDELRTFFGGCSWFINAEGEVSRIGGNKEKRVISRTWENDLPTNLLPRRHYLILVWFMRAGIQR